MYKKNIIRLLFLIIFISFIVGCKNDISKNIKETNTKYNYEINDKVINDILKKLSVADEKSIKNIIYIDNYYYFVYLAADSKTDKLYKYKENDDIKLLLEKDCIELYNSKNFLYVYYDDINSKLIHNVVYINDFENDLIMECYSFNDDKIKFSNTNRYFAILNNFSLTIYDGAKIIYNEKLTKSLNDYEESELLKLNPIKSLEFTRNDNVLFVNYSLSNLKNLYYKIDLTNLKIEEYSFEKHGYYGDENYKFNPDTGDVLYIGSNVYPIYRYIEPDLYDYDFLGYSYGKIKHEYDNTDKFLYLRNIYTQEMFLIDKVEISNQLKYVFNFDKNDQIEINNKTIIGNIRASQNLVYADISSNTINSTLGIDIEASNAISKFIKDRYNIESEPICSMTYNEVAYVVMNIPQYNLTYNKYEKIDGNNISTIELWKYENGDCKRLLYNQRNLTIYNMVSDNNYLMIMGYPGYVVKFDNNKNIIYESKFTGFSKSPNDKYTLIYNGDESLSVLEDNKMILNHNFKGTDDINTFWQQTVSDLREYWWDVDFNKLYTLIGVGNSPLVDIYCVDLEKNQVKYYGNLKFWSHENINKKYSYIHYTTSISGGGIDSYYEDFYIKKKHGNYLYNIRTNESFYLSDYLIYNDANLDDTLITFNEVRGSGEPTELKVDIGNYIDTERVKIIDNIKYEIITKSNNNLKQDNIELAGLYKSMESFYQIVKINNTLESNSTSYELWKYENNKYELIFNNCSYINSIERNNKVYLCIDNKVYKIQGSNIVELCNMQVNKMFLSNNSNYLCIISNNGELKVYDENDICIIDTNIYSDKLLNEFKNSKLEIGECYSYKFDRNIFITIKSNDKLDDVINIDLANKQISSTGGELDCMYENYFVNTVTGIMIYQTGPSIIARNEYNNKYLTREDAKRSLIAINLVNMKKLEIDSGESCFYTFDINTYNDSLTYHKSPEFGITYYFDNDFIN